MPVAALDFYKDQIIGKTVVCVISGGNNDIGRMQDMKNRFLLYEGFLHYFIVNFPQRAGTLCEFLDEYGEMDDTLVLNTQRKTIKTMDQRLLELN